MFQAFPHFHQVEASDCGPTCLKIILKYYGKNCDLSFLRELAQITKVGSSLADLKQAGEKLDFHTTPFKVTIETLENDVLLPCILHWEQDHYVVLYKIERGRFYISDPKFGKIVLKENEFLRLWNQNNIGFGLQLIPQGNFVNTTLPFKKAIIPEIFRFILQALKNQSQKIFWLCVLMLISSVIAYILPQTIKEMFNQGFSNKDTKIIYSIFFFQVFIFIGSTIVSVVQNFIGIHFSLQISITLLRNLLHKIANLPLHFFENKLYSDLLQKIEEQNKIEQLFSKHLISGFFGFLLLCALIFTLFTYSSFIALSIIGFVVFSIAWIHFFFKRRKIIDYFSYKLNSENKNHLVEMLSGMVVIKLFNSQKEKIQQWDQLQSQIYKNKVKSLFLEQYQSNTINIIQQLLALGINFICTIWVIEQKLSIGEMISIGYIIGIISSPINSISSLIRSIQDSKLVYERTMEIYNQKDESFGLRNGDTNNLSVDIQVRNIYFKYLGAAQPMVLENIDINIESGKITAIVGESGSGKTTLLKLLLGFYNPTRGYINIGNQYLSETNMDWWRENCGVVMQDTFIFSGSIAENITMKKNISINEDLINACNIANIYEFITSLPMQFDTIIGNAGVQLSGGQLQRILIARAVYKNPPIIFLDEATSALDAQNEKIIHKNLNNYFKGKTVLIIAHRLSTVKNADQIIVLKKGRISESGNHQSLVSKQGEYYQLIKNQIEL